MSAFQYLIVMNNGIGQMFGASFSHLSGFPQHEGAASHVSENIAADISPPRDGGINLQTEDTSFEKALCHLHRLDFGGNDINAPLGDDHTAFVQFDRSQFHRQVAAVGAVHTEGTTHFYVVHVQRSLFQLGVVPAAVQVDDGSPLIGSESGKLAAAGDESAVTGAFHTQFAPFDNDPGSNIKEKMGAFGKNQPGITGDDKGLGKNIFSLGDPDNRVFYGGFLQYLTPAFLHTF